MNWDGNCASDDGMIFSVHDYSKRGLDSNYLTQSLGERNTDLDAGEYFMPMLVTQEEIDGISFPESKQAYYRVTEDRINYILVYESVGCTFKELDGKISECVNKRLPKDETSGHYSIIDPPAAAKKTATASAVIMVCKKNSLEDCKLPQDFLKKHNVDLSINFNLVINTQNISTDENTFLKVFFR